MWASVISWLGGLGIGTIIKSLLCGLVAVVAIWTWNDYKNLRTENAALIVQRDRILAAHKENLRQALKIQKQLKADLEAQAQIADERAKKTASLARQVTALKKIERPEHEKNCPIHPAIVYAIERLRHKDGNSNTD